MSDPYLDEARIGYAMMRDTVQFLPDTSFGMEHITKIEDALKVIGDHLDEIRREYDGI